MEAKLMLLAKSMLNTIEKKPLEITKKISPWQCVKQELKNHFSDDVYEKWLSKIDLHSYSESEVIMCVSSKFLRDWIRREYLENKISLPKAIKEIWLDYNPSLKKISLIYLEGKPEISDSEKSTIINNKPQGNVISISKYDNVFTFGIDLNPKFTFENFIVGSCNKLATSISKVIAKVEESVFLDQDINPLFLYGGVGLGKTHLSQAIAWHIKENDKSSKVLYISAERFMYQFIRALRGKNILDFKESFRSVDILIIDDFHFISGKDGTQEELLNTLNILIEDNKKIILVCDKSPGDLNNISVKLRSKISSGFIADFKCPNYATRLKILESKSKDFEFEIKQEVLELLASKINSNVRDLEGALKKIAANYIFTEQEINIKNTKDLLRDIFRTSHNETSIEKIQKITAKHFDIKISDLKSKCRNQEFARPRQIAMYLSKKLTDKNLPEIGQEFGGKNHATVIHAIKKIEELAYNNSKFANDLKQIEAMVA